jgi:hypothetical protein
MLDELCTYHRRMLTCGGVLLPAEVVKYALLLAEVVWLAEVAALLLLVNGEDGLIASICGVAIGRCWRSWCC